MTPPSSFVSYSLCFFSVAVLPLLCPSLRMAPLSSFVSYSLCFFSFAVRCASGVEVRNPISTQDQSKIDDFPKLLALEDCRKSVMGSTADVIPYMDADLRKIAARVWVNDVMFKVVDCDARNILCEAVEKHHSSMLVVGSHGYGAIKSSSSSNIFFAAYSIALVEITHGQGCLRQSEPSVDSWKFNIHSRYLHENRLTGSIPTKLENLTKLHYLELNDILPIGNIPSELGKLTDLFDLNVARNHFEGHISDNLCSCTDLNGLNLSYNDLKGPIPIELSGLAFRQ
ncbi:hypothetical protein OROHE_020517 [Orobanche hederae]